MTWRRRQVLRGLMHSVAVGVGLPLLEQSLNTHGTAMADRTALPKRFGVFFWGGGARDGGWRWGQTDLRPLQKFCVLEAPISRENALPTKPVTPWLRVFDLFDDTLIARARIVALDVNGAAVTSVAVSDATGN